MRKGLRGRRRIIRPCAPLSQALEPRILLATHVSISDAQRLDDGGVMQFTVTRTGDLSAAMTIPYLVSSKTAQLDGDTLSHGDLPDQSMGMVEFAAGASSALISIPLLPFQFD